MLTWELERYIEKSGLAAGSCLFTDSALGQVHTAGRIFPSCVPAD